MLKRIGNIIQRKMIEGSFTRSFVSLIGLIIEMITKIICKICLFILVLVKKLLYYPDQAFGILGKYLLAKKIPVEKDKIMLLTFQGDYTCNPKKIADEMIKQGLPYKLVWAIKSSIPNSDYPLELQYVKHNTYDFYKEISSAKVIIENTNIVERLHVFKKPDQYLLQTWHGSLGIKRLDGDVVMGAAYRRLARNCQKKVDFLLSNSTFETEVFETSYWKGVPSLLTGHARNDIFFVGEKEKQQIKEKVYRSLKIAPEKKLFLFAPTHRDNVEESYEALEYGIIRNALEERFGGEWQIIIRLHNRLKKVSRQWLRGLPSYVSDATAYEDMQELLVCTEVGVTDYSSWIFDYVLSNKPGFIIQLGIDEFKEQRGFYYPIETTPFPIASDSLGLAENIKKFDDVKYQKEVKRFLAERGCMEDGHASERIVEQIKELMEK